MLRTQRIRLVSAKERLKLAFRLNDESTITQQRTAAMVLWLAASPGGYKEDVFLELELSLSGRRPFSIQDPREEIRKCIAQGYIERNSTDPSRISATRRASLEREFLEMIANSELPDSRIERKKPVSAARPSEASRQLDRRPISDK